MDMVFSAFKIMQHDLKMPKGQKGKLGTDIDSLIFVELWGYDIIDIKYIETRRTV